MNFLRACFIASPLLFLCSCHGDKTKDTTQAMAADSLKNDSDALVLSLTPTVDCLPLYYAQQSGFFKEQGLKVILKTYKSQFDCDTAMLGNTAIGGATDLVRLHYYANQGKKLTAVTALDGKWKLLSSADLRISKITSLRNRMISVARFSVSDWLSDQALKASNMVDAEVFHPQVNDYALRTAMLNGNQLDAAVLPEPYATQASLSGHRVLFQSNEMSSRARCLVFKPSVIAHADSSSMVSGIIAGYNRAASEINGKGKGVCHNILLNEYKISQAAIDSLTLPKYQQALLPDQKTISGATSFLIERGHWHAKDKSEDLFNDKFTTKE